MNSSLSNLQVYKDSRLLARLQEFYSIDEHCRQFCRWHPKGKGTISCRMMEYFVNVYTISRSVNTVAGHNVHMDFLAARKKWHVRRFDPLARGHKVMLQYKHHTIQTSVPQLNFFIWAITNQIFQTLFDLKEDVSRELAQHNERKRRNCHAETVISNGRSTLDDKAVSACARDPAKAKQRKRTSMESMAKKLSPKAGDHVFRLLENISI